MGRSGPKVEGSRQEQRREKKKTSVSARRTLEKTREKEGYTKRSLVTVAYVRQ